MSLQVWLPLTGDLHNQGLSGLTVTNNGATVNNNGKIGKCYQMDSSHYITIASEPWMSMKPAYNFSLFLWVKGTTTGWLIAAGGWELLLRPTFIKISLSGNGQYPANLNQSFDTNTWYHLGFTWNGGTGELKLYLNGSCVATSNVPSSANFSVNSSLKFTYDGPRYLNDIRIYDHCLSAKEVEEIAKGLVLHYKLDDKFCESTTNLCSNLKAGGRTILSTNPLMITTTGENSDTYWYVQTSSALVGGSTYTLSLQCSGLAPGEYFQFGIGAQSGSNNCGHFAIYNGYNEKTFTLASGLDGVTQFILDDSSYSSGVRSKRVSFYNVQLEKKDHATGYAGPGGSRTAIIIYDSSGYNNNGEQSNITIITPSPRYSVATNFSNSAYIKVTDNKWMAQGIKEMTINLLAKASSWPTTGHLFSCTESGGFNLEAGNSGYWRFPIHVYTNEAQSTTAYKYDSQEIKISDLPTNEWVMFTLVYDGTGTKTYINGELHHTYSNISYGIHFNTNARLFLACEANTANPYTPYFTGQMSDFRLYYTAFSENQIKELYNTSMTIDNNGNVYSRELVEI